MYPKIICLKVLIKMIIYTIHALVHRDTNHSYIMFQSAGLLRKLLEKKLFNVHYSDTGDLYIFTEHSGGVIVPPHQFLHAIIIVSVYLNRRNIQQKLCWPLFKKTWHNSNSCDHCIERVHFLLRMVTTDNQTQIIHFPYAIHFIRSYFLNTPIP